MEKIQLSYFRENFSAVMDSVTGSDKHVLITDKEKTLAKLIPVSSVKKGSWLECMKDTGKITGDIVSMDK